jgi:phage minor structural protein
MNQVRIVNNLNQPIAILENAFKIGYEKSVNKLWRAWFSMPGDDEKLSYCQPFAYVEVWENGERVELFRIVPFQITKDENVIYDFECEHVLATLIDDVLFQYHEIGGTGIFTTTVINYVLARQTVTNWQLGTNAFNRQFLYKWENENLLGSLFSIPNLFLEPYKWSFDTTAYPWTVNLDAINSDVKS